MPHDLATIDHWPLIQQQANCLVESGLVPDIKNAAQAVVKIWFGREIGLPASVAVKSIHFIDGKPNLDVHAMEYQLLRGGVTYNVDEHTADKCTITFRRNEMRYTVTYTRDDAKLAGLLDKTNWKRHPKDMLYARAFARGAQRIGADLLGGMVYEDEPETASPRDELRARIIEKVGGIDTAAKRDAARTLCRETTGYDKPDLIPDEEVSVALEKLS